MLDITWIQNANLPLTSGYDDDGLMNPYEAVAWADNLVYAGFTDWRLPDAQNFNGSDPFFGWHVNTNEMGRLYYIELGNQATMQVGDFSGLQNAGPFENLMPFRYWSKTPYYMSPAFWWYFNFGSGYQWDAVSGAQCYAWAVRDGDVSPVPIPATVLLLLPALGSIAVLKKCRSNISGTIPWQQGPAASCMVMQTKLSSRLRFYLFTGRDAGGNAINDHQPFYPFTTYPP